MFEKTDTHVHVFDPWRFPYVSHRAYTPGAATTSDLLRHLERIGCGRVVCVQPSVYGTNNSCLLDALTRLNRAGVSARGVVVLDRSITLDQMKVMNDVGVRAVRINWVVKEPGRNNEPSALIQHLLALDEQLGSMGWSIELFAKLSDICCIAPQILKIKRNVVIDHFALVKPADPGDRLALAGLLGRTPNLYLKLSAPYQVSTQRPEYGDLSPLLRNLIELSSGRLLWGSNWPHTSGHTRSADHVPGDIEPFRYEDDVRTLASIQAQMGSVLAWEQLMIQNPSIVFGFN